MKMLLAMGFVLLGMSRFTSFPAENDPAWDSKYNDQQDTTKKPQYLPEKIILASLKVLTVKDTAQKTEDIGRILNKGYGELYSYIGQHNLKPGKVMAFYYSSHLPFVMEAAVEVDALPVQLTGRIKAKEIKGGEAVVVHYKGPYDQISVAYNAITKWLKENHKEAWEAPFEVYLNDPGTVSDPTQLRTDVYQRIK